MWWASDQYLQSSCKSTVYNRHRSAIGLVYLRLPGVSTVMFRYYLLGGDTAAPSGLCARLCHAFVVFYLHCLYQTVVAQWGFEAVSLKHEPILSATTHPWTITAKVKISSNFCQKSWAKYRNRWCLLR